MDNTAMEIASTIQSTTINRHPSPSHDLNPGTAASKKIPLMRSTTVGGQAKNPQMTIFPPSSPSAILPTLLPRPRRATFPPLPDMRFEQSYLASIPPGASATRIAWITTRDHVLMPLVTGAAWTLLLAGWRYWNRGASMLGESFGARIRRWWWKVNNWEAPSTDEVIGAGGVRGLEAKHVEEFYQTQMGAGGD